jgi:hypothetical protein
MRRRIHGGDEISGVVVQGVVNEYAQCIEYGTELIDGEHEEELEKTHVVLLHFHHRCRGIKQVASVRNRELQFTWLLLALAAGANYPTKYGGHPQSRHGEINSPSILICSEFFLFLS